MADDYSYVDVVQALVNVEGHPTFTTPKGDRTRRLHLDPFTAGVLKAHKAAQNRERLLASTAWLENDLVFCRASGEPERPERITRTFQARAKAAELPVIRFHDIRHSVASHALETGTPMEAISERLGHASISITADIYSHVMPRTDQALADKLAALYQ